MRSAPLFQSRDRDSRWERFKKPLLRMSVLLAVAFVVFQVNVAGDPVRFYMQVVGDVASPAMSFSEEEDAEAAGEMVVEKVDASGNPAGGTGETSQQDALTAEASEGQTVEIFLRTTPAQAGLRVWQDENNLGVVPAEGKTFMVKQGRVLLDARGLGEGISVEIQHLGKKYVIDMSEEIKAFHVMR